MCTNVSRTYCIYCAHKNSEENVSKEVDCDSMGLTIISDVKNNKQKFWNGKIYGTHVKVHTI